MASNPRNSMPPGQGVANGFHTNGVAAMPHIEDVIALPKDIDRNQPVKRLLEIAEASLRQAEFSRDIKRLGPALQDFLKASIITVQYIGQHRDYEFVKSRPELAARHATLLKKIKQQNDDFARIKEQIIADNKRTGVLPTSSRPGSSHTTNGPRPSSSSSDRPSPSFTSSHSRNGSAVNGSAIKSKPTVQPKPASLHGNSLKMGHARANSLASTTSGSSTQDLAARFANLRGPQASPGQDPRIKTHHINLPEKPAGPRAMPSPTKPQLSIVSSVPSLPKLPDAIYSPARGSVSGEAGRLPSSTNRGLFSRTASTVSATSSPNLSRQQSHASDYFGGAQTPTNGSSLSRASSRDTSLDMPRGDSLTPEALVHVMKTKVSILLIDVRSREEFNEGHIMHSTIICIEPGILERESISADEISQSMVLAPNQEQAHFERRNTFDLVVFYDESSSEVPTRYDTNEELVIMSLHRALVQFNYGKELKHPPKILKGGLEAWVDLMGSGSLQSTADPSSRSQPSHRNRNVTIERRRSRYVVKQLKPDDIKQWEETIQKDDQDVAASPNFVRTREDFLRRFPSVSMGQQSMTAPVEPRPRYGSSHKNDLESELPSPPSRPAPALPRQSYSGFAQGPDDQEAHDGTIAQKLSGPAGKSTTQVVPAEAPKFYTGLTNPHNWCYANGLLQSLLASPEFGREMANSEWVKRHVVPRKPDEKMDHPQLMTRIVSNLFHWMSSGKFQVMKAQTLMDYVRHLCKQSSSAIQFGGSNQQDAQEFMGFLLDVIHDETNVHRNLKGKETQPPEPSKTGLSVLQTAARFWQSHLQFNQSIIDRYWRLLEVTEVRCRECATRTFTFSSWFCLMLPVTEATTLEAAIKKKCQPELIQGFHCNHCRRATNSDRSEYYARMPPLVCVVLNRFNALTSSSKCVDRVSWDFNNLDLSPYFLNPADCTTSSSDVSLANDPAFTGPFHYECYAVLIHVGGSVNSGHYYAYVRDQGTHDPYAWYCCNDERVTKVRIGCGGAGDERERVFKTGADAVPYMAFFRRKQGR